MNSLRIRSFVFLLALSLVAHAGADIILYGSTGNTNATGGGRLFQINVTTQTVTPIGNTGFDYLGGIAFASNGVLYGAAGGSANATTLMTIDPLTGAATTIGTLSNPDFAVDGLRFNSQGVLYGASYDNNAGVGMLVTINPSNGTVLSSLTLVGSGNSFAPGIAFDPINTLYGSRGNSAGRAEDIDLVNPTTGALTPLGSLEAIISDIVFSSDGSFYGCSPSGELYQINPATGSKTLLFDTNINNLSGLAAPVPEPSSLALLGFAIVILLIYALPRHVLK